MSKLKASDLQIAGITTSSVTKAFSMAHKMGLVCIPMITQSDVTKDRYYLSGETDYNWITGTTSVTSSSSYSGNIPYMPDNKHYFVAKPGPTSFATTSSQTGFSSTLSSVDNSWSSGTITVAGGMVSNVSISMSTFAYITNNSYTIAIGDVLYQDGALSHYGSSVYTDHTPIALLFSTTTSTLDYNTNKWTHGYAMALKDAGTAAWYTSNTGLPTGEAVGSTPNLYKTSIDGYKHTVALKNTGNSAAAVTAWNYNVSVDKTIITNFNPSNWYLPSSGQWYSIFINLAGMTEASFTPQSNLWGYWVNQAQNAADALNTRMANVTSDYTSFIVADQSSDVNIRPQSYWSSNEWGTTEAHGVHFYSKVNNTAYLGMNDHGTNPKTTAYKIRPVIAF